MTGRGGIQEAWRWRPPRRTDRPTIVVSDISNEAKERIEEKVRRGARVEPFGFARALSEPPAAVEEPTVWEGDYA